MFNQIREMLQGSYEHHATTCNYYIKDPPLAIVVLHRWF